MIDTKLMADGDRACAATAGAKLILVGDDRQLSSIDRGGMFGALKDRYGAAALDRGDAPAQERRPPRGRDDGGRQLLTTRSASIEEKGAIHWTRTQDEARAALVEQWAKDSAADPAKSRFVFAYTNVDVDQLNADLRAVRRERGELGEDRELPTAARAADVRRRRPLQFTGTDKKLGTLQRHGRHHRPRSRHRDHRAARRPTWARLELRCRRRSEISGTAMPARSTEGRAARSTRPISITPNTGARRRAMSR